MRIRTHTHSNSAGEYDVLHLFELVKGREFHLLELSVLKVSRSKRSGFSKKKYRGVDLKYPVLVHEGRVVDGRHRVCRLQDCKAKFVRVIFLTDKDMEKARIR